MIIWKKRQIIIPGIHFVAPPDLLPVCTVMLELNRQEWFRKWKADWPNGVTTAAFFIVRRSQGVPWQYGHTLYQALPAEPENTFMQVQFATHLPHPDIDYSVTQQYLQHWSLTLEGIL